MLGEFISQLPSNTVFDALTTWAAKIWMNKTALPLPGERDLQIEKISLFGINVNKLAWCMVTTGLNQRLIQIHYLKRFKSLRETHSWCFPYLHMEGLILNPLSKLISIPQPTSWGSGTLQPHFFVFMSTVDSKIFLKAVWKLFYGCPWSGHGHVGLQMEIHEQNAP